MGLLAQRIHELYNGRNLEEVADALGITVAAVQARLLDPSLPDPPGQTVHAKSLAVGYGLGRAIDKAGNSIAALDPHYYWGDAEPIDFEPSTHRAIPWENRDVEYGWIALNDPTVVEFAPGGYGYSYIGDPDLNDFRRASLIDIGFDMPWRSYTIREWWLNGGAYLAHGLMPGYDLSAEEQTDLGTFVNSAGVADGIIAGGAYYDASTVRYQTLGDPGRRIFVAEWDLTYNGGPGHLRVQAHLHENGIVELHFQTVDVPATFALTAGLAHQFYGGAIERLPAVVDSIPLDYASAPGIPEMDGKAVRLTAARVERYGLAEPLPDADRYRREEIRFGWIDIHDGTLLAERDFGSQNDSGTTRIIDPGFPVPMGPAGPQRDWVIGINAVLFTWSEEYYESPFEPNQVSESYGDQLRRIGNDNTSYQQNGVAAGAVDLALPSYFAPSALPEEWTGIRYKTVGEAPHRIFVVEYCVPYYSQDGDIGPGVPGNYIAVQVHLHENGVVEIHHKHDSPPESYAPSSGSGPTSGIWWSSPYYAGQGYVSYLNSVLDGAIFDYNNWVEGDPHGGGIPSETATRFTPVESTNYAVLGYGYIDSSFERLRLPCEFPFGPSGKSADWWVNDYGQLVTAPWSDSYTPRAPFIGGTRTHGLASGHHNMRAAFGVSALLSQVGLGAGNSEDLHHVFYTVEGEAPNRTLVADFFALDGQGDEWKFQIAVHESGEIDLRYKQPGTHPADFGPMGAGLWWDEADQTLDPDDNLDAPTRALTPGGTATLDGQGGYAPETIPFLTEKTYRFTPAAVFADRAETELEEGVILVKDLPGRTAPRAPAGTSLLVVRNGVLSRIGERGDESPVAGVTEAELAAITASVSSEVTARSAAVTAEATARAAAVTAEATARAAADLAAASIGAVYAPLLGITPAGAAMLQVWLRGDRPGTYHGRDMVAWPDQGPHHYSVGPPGARPYSGDSLNGVLAVTMDGAPVNLTALTPGSFTWFAVLKIASAPVDADHGHLFEMLGSTGQNGPIFYIDGDRKLATAYRDSIGRTINRHTSADIVALNTAVVVGLRYNGDAGPLEYFLNGRDPAVPDARGWWNVGGQMQFGQQLEDAVVAEVLAFDGHLPDTDWDWMGEHLMVKYNIP